MIESGTTCRALNQESTLQVEWDYTHLADAYLKRPAYAEAAIEEFLARTGTQPGDAVCDIGAGTGILTAALARRGLRVSAVEPNASMSAHGQRQTSDFKNVRWQTAKAEETHQDAQSFQLVTFGSSFNVTDRPRALAETARILRPGGWMVCLFNHRDLTDPVQANVQKIIDHHVPGFQHGSRREDQTPFIEASDQFGPVQSFERTVVHCVSCDDYVDAWNSHCTLQRQAGERFSDVIRAIAEWLQQKNLQVLEVPYQTRVWLAPLVTRDS